VTAGAATTSTIRSVTDVPASVEVSASASSAEPPVVVPSVVESSVPEPPVVVPSVVESSVPEPPVVVPSVVESSVPEPPVVVPCSSSLTELLKQAVEEAMAAGKSTLPSLEATPSEPVTSEPVTSEPVTSEPVASEPVTSEPVTSEPVTSEPVTSEPVTSEEVNSDTPLADGESAGMPAVGGQRDDEDATLGERALNQDMADITLVRMGSMNCVNGDELRMILSIQNNNECLTIRDACVLYSDLKEMLNQFDGNAQMLKDEKSSRYVRSWHLYYARSILIVTSGFAYAWLAVTFHSWS